MRAVSLGLVDPALEARRRERSGERSTYKAGTIIFGLLTLLGAGSLW